MRRKFVEKTSFFSLLDELSNLPDNITSIPYYFKDSSKVDMFVTFTRHEVNDITQEDIFEFNNFEVNFCVNHAGTNRQKVGTFCMYTFSIHYDYFTMPIFKLNFHNIHDFFMYVSEQIGDFKEIYNNVQKYIQELHLSKEFVLI